MPTTYPNNDRSRREQISITPDKDECNEVCCLGVDGLIRVTCVSKRRDLRIAKVACLRQAAKRDGIITPDCDLWSYLGLLTSRLFETILKKTDSTKHETI